MPLCVSCPGPVLHLFCTGGGLAGSLPPPAGLWVARRFVGGSVRLGRSSVWGVFGGGLTPPLGGMVRSGAVGGSRGVGSRGSLCLGPSLCLPSTGTKAGYVRVAQSTEGVVSILPWFVSLRSRPGAPPGGRRGASLCTGGSMGAPRMDPVPLGPRRHGLLGGEGGGGVPWPGGGVQGRRPPVGHRHSGRCGGGRRGAGGTRVVQPLFSPPALQFISSAAPGGGLKAEAWAPSTDGFPCVSGGSPVLPWPV